MSYMSLREATKFCDYSQEYLSLRARQGKLQAVKIGRNWATTREWLQQYNEKAHTYHSNHKTVEPPPSLPVYAPDADEWEWPTPVEVARRFAFWQNVKFAFACVMVTALVVSGVAQGRQSVLRVADEATPAVLGTAQSLQASVDEAGFSLGAHVAQWSGAGIVTLAREYVDWLGNGVRAIANWFVPTPESGKNGLVVIPSTDDNERVKKQVQQSFSDEVLVTPYDEESGVITPVFRDRKGEDYLYILVPIRGQE